MAIKTKQTEIAETKENLFALLKSIDPILFGDKVFADVERFGDMSEDPSHISIVFKKVNE